MPSPFEQLFDISPFPAVISRLRDNSRHRHQQAQLRDLRHLPGRRGRADDHQITTPTSRIVNGCARRSRRPGAQTMCCCTSGSRTARRSGRGLGADDHLGQRAGRADGDRRHQRATRAEHALEASEQRLAAQSDALTSLTASHADPTTRSTIACAAFSKWLRRRWRSSASACGASTTDAPPSSASGLYRRSAGRARIRRACSHADAAPAYFDGARAGARHRRARRADRSADQRVPRASTSSRFDIGAMLDVPLRQRQRDRRRALRRACRRRRAPGRVDEQNFAISVANLDRRGARRRGAARRRSRRLAESEARARLIVDTAHDAFIGIDSAGRIVDWNAQAEATFGWTRDEVARPHAGRDDHPAGFREAHVQRHAALPRHRRGAGRQPAARADARCTGPDASFRSSSPSPRRCGASDGYLLRRVPARHLRAARARRRSCAAPRSRPKRRRAPRASSSPT